MAITMHCAIDNILFLKEALMYTPLRYKPVVWVCVQHNYTAVACYL